MADRPRVAIVYDWLTSLGGAERVLDAVVELLPGAPIYTLLYRKEVFRGSLVAERAVHTSSLDRLPLARTHYRAFLPLMPWAVERFDLRDYDLIVSLSHAVAHGVLHRPDQLHISYTSTPARYAWSQPATALRERVGVGRAFAASWALHYFRLWDLSAAQRVDRFVAISHWVRRNVWRYYRRRAQVVYPPVDLGRYQPLAPRGGNWREGASSRTVLADAVGFHIRLHPELELRQFLCPGCGGSLSVEAAEKGAPDIQDIELA